ALTRRNGDRQQFFNTFFAKALTPAGQARRVNRRLNLQVRFTGENLPIRVLDPAPHDIVIREVKRVLQVQQAGDQSRRGSRAATSGLETTGTHRIDAFPFDQVGQLDQG